MEDTTIYITFRLTETPPYAVVDAYTGNRHNVQGLSGVYAVRFGEVNIPAINRPALLKQAQTKEAAP
jgi:hypothetical protein